jgi:hypothetical protein
MRDHLLDLVGTPLPMTDSDCAHSLNRSAAVYLHPQRTAVPPTPECTPVVLLLWRQTGVPASYRSTYTQPRHHRGCCLVSSIGVAHGISAWPSLSMAVLGLSRLPHDVKKTRFSSPPATRCFQSMLTMYTCPSRHFPGCRMPDVVPVFAL